MAITVKKYPNKSQFLGYIDPEVFKRFRAWAVAEGMRPSQAATMALREWLERHPLSQEALARIEHQRRILPPITD